MNGIGIGEELPEIPQELSQGKDFLDKCLVKDPNKRWTAHMLLNHPFIKNPLPQPLPSMDHIPSPSLICFCISLGLNSVGIFLYQCFKFPSFCLESSIIFLEY